jgi:ribonucleoside-diphosphate reductase alpha subunit
MFKKLSAQLCDNLGIPEKMSTINMQVVKRDSSREDVSFDKVLLRIKKQAEGLEVNPTLIAQRTLARIYDGVQTAELDELAAQLSISLVTTHPDYGTLASRIAITNHHRNTLPSFYETMKLIGNQTHEKTTKPMKYLSDEYMSYIELFGKEIDEYIVHERDFLLDYFGFKTLEKQKYLMRSATGKTLERPQYLWMRVALSLWGEHAKKQLESGVSKKDALSRVFETYDLVSQKYFIHATPTNFNAGSPRQQMSSCYLLSMHDDSISGIYKTLSDCAQISKYAGGIGLHIHNIRARGTHIAGNGGTSTGIVPMLRNFNATARYVDQGSKRNGSFAIYLEPWHADIEDFLKLKMNTGSEEERARDLFYALWIPDLFMERVKENKSWTLFCPHEAPGLADVHSEKFRELYERYEAEGLGKRQVDAQKLWFKILDSQIETGTPYLLYKDAANAKSNQQNLGTIKSSNLCTEVIEYSDKDETAVCNLASIALPTYANAKAKSFDFIKLREVVKVVVRNLNRVIDINFYPTPETKTSNMRHRPIGLGVQGLADVFAMMRTPWETPKAADFNQRVFEHMYYAAVEASCEIAMEDGPYSSYEGSPMSKGQFQYDLWGITPLTKLDSSLDWDALKENVAKHGVRNSLLVAPMPTASTSQILGFNECFEPFTSNIYTRRTLSGEYIIVNKYLLRDLIRLDMWSEDMKNMIIAKNGSIQDIDEIPEPIKNLYRTSWEIKQKTLIDMAASRGGFICQSQSLNLFMADPTYVKLSSMHFYGWEKGLKTGIYYLRTKAPVMAQKFTIDPELEREANKSEEERKKKSFAVDEGCLTCSA